MDLSIYSPNEDEFALAVMCGLLPYLYWVLGFIRK